MAEAATIARPYAKAAFMSARDARSLPAWSQALRAASGMLADARVTDLVTSPKVSIDQLGSLFAGIGGGGIDVQWRNFVGILAQAKRLELLPQIAEQYELLRAQQENELDVQVTSAVALDAGQKAGLAAALKKRFAREVRMTTDVDPKLLGGAIIHAGDLVIDGSLSGRLQRLASELSV